MDWTWHGASDATNEIVWLDAFGGSSSTVTYRASYPDPEPNEPPSELEQLDKRVEAVCERGRL